MTGQSNAAVADLVNEIKAASERIATADATTKTALESLRQSIAANDNKQAANDNKFTAQETKLTTIETGLHTITEQCKTLEVSLNDVLKRQGRLGPGSDVDVKEREAAIEMCRLKHEMRITKKDAEHPFNPTEDQIKEAIAYRKALPMLMNCTTADQLPADCRKSLSAFAFGSNAFILAPEMSNTVIRCITDPTDLTGLMSSMTISSPSVRFMIDNGRIAVAAWACEASCFANNPQPDLQEGIGELEIKPETIRYIQCASRDLLEDASVNIEQWMINRVSEGIRATIHNSLLMGDGIGKPMGIMHPNAGIPIAECSPATQPGQFSWQDLIQLKFSLPMEWIAGGTYLMNQRTFALLQTMSDASGRPLLTQFPQALPTGFSFAGSPIAIATQMPDVAPGATPVAFGDFKRAYMIVWRKAITMQQDPYSAGFCVLYKFEARVGGGILCPNAVRLLRIH